MLPVPDQPFGLDLARTSATDAELEGIGRFQQAQALILDGAHITKAVLREIKQLTNLRAISGMPATDEWLKELHGLKSLETLDLSHSKVSDDGIKELRFFRNLWALDLEGTRRVTHVGLSRLNELRNLRSLRIGFRKIGDKDIRALNQLESLQFLDLRDAELTDGRIEELRSLRGLRGLVLVNNPAITDDGIAALKNLTRLEILDLDATSVTDAGMKHIKGLRALRRLELGCTDVTEIGFSELRDLKDLRRLSLGPKVRSFDDLEFHPQIEVLDVQNNKHMNETQMQLVRRLRKIRSLNLSDTGVTDTAIIGFCELKALARLNWSGTKALERLNLSGTFVSARGLEALGAISTLVELDLSRTAVGDEDLKKLSGLKQLRWLNLRDTHVTDAGLQHLKELNRLQWLNLSRTEVTKEGAAELRKALPEWNE
jgi:Leucine-rich repeat (LRR) protein